MAVISQRAYAKHRGCALSAVQRAIKAGRITTSADKAGKAGIDPEVADKLWQERTDKTKQRKKKTPVTKVPSEDPELDPDEPDGDMVSFDRAQKIEKNYKARLARLEYEEKMGELVNADKVKSQTFATARSVRDALLNIPNRYGSELCGITDPVKFHTTLTRVINEALQELVDDGRGRSRADP